MVVREDPGYWSGINEMRRFLRRPETQSRLLLERARKPLTPRLRSDEPTNYPINQTPRTYRY